MADCFGAKMSEHLQLSAAGLFVKPGGFKIKHFAPETYAVDHLDHQEQM